MGHMGETGGYSGGGGEGKGDCRVRLHALGTITSANVQISMLGSLLLL